ncbi:hypothetical protein PVK06_025016 [Gossypium arboreum]|uniref:RNase H type-1 domain-containing protein n=1 Tax=Gossypium arboreum TaxID=29729 RepID=A0ABR0PFH0_GOSAR|nr:hypothetical protein PVK06_025016 [Gossypium arboreum]
MVNFDMVAPNERHVKDLWNNNEKKWNENIAHAIYGDFVGDQICNISIGDDDKRDRVVWFHNPHSYYSSKFAYSWLLLKQVGLGPHRSFWRAIWKLKTLPKECPRCGFEKETLIHALKDCQTVRTILSMGGLDNRLLDKDYDRCKEDVAHGIWERAKSLSHDFRIHNLVHEPVIPTAPSHKRWEKPPKDYMKVNFDAAINNKKIGYGFIIRDEDGFVLGGGGGFNDEIRSMEWAEILAFEESLKKGKTLSVSNLIFETNNTGIMNRMKKRDSDITTFGARINKIQKLMLENFTSANIRWANRSCNRIADFICKFANEKNCIWDFNMDYLVKMYNLVLDDSI